MKALLERSILSEILKSFISSSTTVTFIISLFAKTSTIYKISLFLILKTSPTILNLPLIFWLANTSVGVPSSVIWPKDILNTLFDNLNTSLISWLTKIEVIPNFYEWCEVHLEA